MFKKLKKWAKKAWNGAKKVWKGVKKVARAVVTAIVQVVNVIKEFLNRFLGVLEFLATLLGWMPDKRMRLYVVILRDGRRLVANYARVRQAVIGAEQILVREANTHLFVGGWPMWSEEEEEAPAAALRVSCNVDAWKEDFDEAGAYFKSKQLRANSGFISFTSLLTGYGAPVTVFFVREVGNNKRGCSLGPLSDYVTVEDADAQLIAHEIGHACGLWHMGGECFWKKLCPNNPSNLMHPNANGEKLSRWQKAIFRNSRHVTFV
jgi:hypothetical protein